jgi:hypothetical protein
MPRLPVRTDGRRPMRDSGGYPVRAQLVPQLAPRGDGTGRRLRRVESPIGMG